MKMTQRETHYGIRAALVLMVLGFLFVMAPSAGAHARMVKSSPAKDAELAAAPAQIDLWFNELLEDGFNTIDVYPYAELDSRKHANLAQGKVTVDGNDRTHLIVKLGPLEPGRYVVDWRVLSRDGHSAPGRITFTVKAK
jgi:copper resistance protein C